MAGGFSQRWHPISRDAPGVLRMGKHLVKKTGWPPPVLMQDDNRGLSRWLANRGNSPLSRQQAEQAAATIKEENEARSLPQRQPVG